MRHLVEEFLPGTARRPHPEVFQRAAEAGKFVAFKVIKGDDRVGLGDRRADPGEGAVDSPDEGTST
jgi:hypothetical protein